jgi:hypothetical protein
VSTRPATRSFLARRARLHALIDEQSRHAEWAALVGRLRCTRGINTPTAIGLVAEIDQFSASRAQASGQLPRIPALGVLRRRPAPSGLRVELAV